MSSVFVVIVNYRTGGLVIDCLASLVGELPALRGGRVVVVDNASGDDSVRLIQETIEGRGWSTWSEVVALPRNGGFAYGNNRAIERARGHDPGLGTIVCLNPDTTVTPGAIDALVSHLDQHPQIGIAGASIEDAEGIVQRTAHRFPSPLGELEAAAQLGVLSRWMGRRHAARQGGLESQVCDWVSGACFAVRAEVLAQTGGLDEGYFLYFEETDLCWRARRAGWRCGLVPTARIRHFEGASTGIAQARRRRPAYWFASRRRFFTRAHGVLGLILADISWAIGRASFISRRALGLGGRVKRGPEPERFARDLLVGDVLAIARGDLRGVRSFARAVAE